MDDRKLVELALEARKHAYVPYSRFAVGAALLGADGRVWQGCNIENAAYGPGNCAERTAIFKAIYDGARDFEAIAVVGGPVVCEPQSITPPCGICRQVLREFCDPESFRVILGAVDCEPEVYLLKEILPVSFGPEYLQ